jgi:hypothetical protein
MPAPTAADIAAANATGEPLLTQGVCHTRVLLESLPAPAQAAALQALLTPPVKTVDIVRVLESHGLPVRAENLGRHRRRLQGGANACKCPVPLRETDAS